MTPDVPESRRGRLLVAAPSLTDPSFHRAVVLLLEHSDEGALGLVLNRPTPLVAREALPARIGLALPGGAHVHEGGPVQPDAVIVLAEFLVPEPPARLIFGRVGVLDPEVEPDVALAGARDVRAFGGYAGWGAGQLEREIAEEAWFDAEPEAEDVFTRRSDGLWARVLERLGGSYRLVARMPPDPSVN